MTQQMQWCKPTRIVVILTLGLTLGVMTATAQAAAYFDQISQTPGLVHYWDLGEGATPGSTNTTTDSINGKVLSHYVGYTGGAPGTPAVVGGGPADVAGPRPATFNGMDANNDALFYNKADKDRSFAANPDQLGSKTFSSPDGVTNITYETWFRNNNAVLEGNVGGFIDNDGKYVLVSPKGAVVNNPYRAINMDANGNQTIYFMGVDATTDWTHMVMTWDGTHLRSYVNGEETPGSKTSSNGLASGALNVPDNFIIGGDAIDNTRYFLGDIDHVGLYDRTLTAEQIKRNYEAATLGSVSSLSSVEAETLARNADHYWRFEEHVSDETAIDSVNAKTGTFLGNATRVSANLPAPNLGFGTDNQALSLTGAATDGVSFDADSVGGSTFAGGVSQLSLSAWFRLDESSNDSTRQIIAGFQQSTGARYNFLMARESDGSLKFYVKDANGAQIIQNPFPGITDSDWHHVVMVWDGPSNMFRAYLDGGNEFSIGGFGEMNLATSDEFFIGRDIIGGNAFHGLIDEVALFNDALSASNVSQLYNSTVPEPGSLALLVLGVGLIATRRSRSGSNPR